MADDSDCDLLGEFEEPGEVRLGVELRLVEAFDHLFVGLEPPDGRSHKVLKAAVRQRERGLDADPQQLGPADPVACV